MEKQANRNTVTLTSSSPVREGQVEVTSTWTLQQPVVQLDLLERGAAYQRRGQQLPQEISAICTAIGCEGDIIREHILSLHRWPIAKVSGSSPGGDGQNFFEPQYHLL